MSRTLTFALAAALLITDPTASLGVAATTTNQMGIDGAAFDRAFVEQMMKEHEEAIEQNAVELFQVDADHSTDNAVTAPAEKKL